MGFYIRRTKDFEQVKILHDKILPTDEHYNHDGNFYWLVKNKKGSPIGFCIATDIGDGLVFLSRAGILPCARGNGLHVRMIKCRVNWARSKGFNSIITYVDIDNVASSKNLIRAGFELYRPDWDYAGHNYNYFRLCL
jgi:RimJ/RimL family protein N-acetyltransferase